MIEFSRIKFSEGFIADINTSSSFKDAIPISAFMFLIDDIEFFKFSISLYFDPEILTFLETIDLTRMIVFS